MKKEKIIIWGFPLHSHTHSYIHYGWYKGFKHLGYETYWFHDGDYPADFDFSNCLFITEGYADNNIPLDPTSIYFVHVCVNPEKYLGKVERLIDIRYLVDGIKDINYNYTLDKEKCIKISDTAYYEKLYDNSGISKYKNNPSPMQYDAFYTCWATDLLPDEFMFDNVEIEKEKIIHWLGSYELNTAPELRLFHDEAIKNGIKFIFNNPWRNPLSFDDVINRTSSSFMSPDIRGAGDPKKIQLGETGTCHKSIGYIPCRIFKAISYGQLGITNSKHVYDLLDGKVIYNSNESQLFYDALENIKNYEMIRESMNLVKEKHTYINRIKDLLKVLDL